MHGQQNIKFIDFNIKEFQQENRFVWSRYISLFFVVWKMCARKLDPYSAALKTGKTCLVIQFRYFFRSLEQV